MTSATQTDLDRSAGPEIQGMCSVIFCFDVGQAIDLNRATEILSRSGDLPSPQREQLQLRRRAPRYFSFDPAPVRFLQSCASEAKAGFPLAARSEATLYDFGGASVVFTIPISGRLGSLVTLANTLAEDHSILRLARSQLQAILPSLEPAISRPRLVDLAEDYVAFQLDRLGQPGDNLETLLHENRRLMAQILRGDTSELSAQEIDEALSSRISYSESDTAILDFAAGFVIGTDASDLLDLIEFANVELLEMRHLDGALDDALEEVYPILSKPGRGRAATRRLRRVAMLQADAAILFEGVNNAIKLVGDHYLARFYKRLAERLHHHDWDASVLRKLETLHQIYEKADDERSTRRMEILEWIIIVLIAVSIVLPFVTPLAK